MVQLVTPQVPLPCSTPLQDKRMVLKTQYTLSSQNPSAVYNMLAAFVSTHYSLLRMLLTMVAVVMLRLLKGGSHNRGRGSWLVLTKFLEKQPMTSESTALGSVARCSSRERTGLMSKMVLKGMSFALAKLVQ